MPEISLFDMKDKIHIRDANVPNPEERAGYIYRILRTEFPNLTTWDLLCFSIEYLASQVVVHNLDMNSVRSLTNQIYLAHYLMKEDPESGISLDDIIREVSRNGKFSSTANTEESSIGEGA